MSRAQPMTTARRLARSRNRPLARCSARGPAHNVYIVSLPVDSFLLFEQRLAKIGNLHIVPDAIVTSYRSFEDRFFDKFSKA